MHVRDAEGGPSVQHLSNSGNRRTEEEKGRMPPRSQMILNVCFEGENCVFCHFYRSNVLYKYSTL